MTTAELDAARDLFASIDEAASATPPGEPLARRAVDAIADAGLSSALVPAAMARFTTSTCTS